MYFVEVDFNRGIWDPRWDGSIKLVIEEKARKDLEKRKPLKAKYVVAEGIVLLDSISKKE